MPLETQIENLHLNLYLKFCSEQGLKREVKFNRKPDVSLACEDALPGFVLYSLWPVRSVNFTG